MTDKTRAYNMDCMIAMRQMPDKAFDLAIVDPPYGLDIAKNGTLNVHSKAGYKKSNWDTERPTENYWKELFRVSKNQIVWGGNYFPEIWNDPCKGFIFWNKLNHHDNRSDGEMAWTSFNRLAAYVEYMWDGNRFGTKGNIKGVGLPTVRIHSTEKPVFLYKWLLKNYAQPGDKILDSHLGSGSSRIAAYDMGFDFTGYELDTEYFQAQEKRFNQHIRQLQLFTTHD